MKYQSALMTHVDGSMHHLGIKKEHIASKVILTPDPMLVSFYSKFLDNCKLMGDYREYVTYTGTYNGQPLSIMSCGFGCMPMAIAIEELNHLDVKEVIKISENPAIQPDIKVGSICAASGAVRSEGASREYIDISYPAVSDMELLAKILDNKNVRVGIFRSHDVENLDSPYAPDADIRIKKWTDLGVDIFDGETSSMFITAACLRMKSASLALVKENYITNEILDEKGIDAKREQMFKLAADILCK